jgi:hypothetical protein
MRPSTSRRTRAARRSDGPNTNDDPAMSGATANASSVRPASTWAITTTIPMMVMTAYLGVNRSVSTAL